MSFLFAMAFALPISWLWRRRAYAPRLHFGELVLIFTALMLLGMIANELTRFRAQFDQPAAKSYAGAKP